jgi:hypothetical protein
MMAPEETFKQGFPVMQAILNSLKENAAAINAKGAAERKQADQIVDRTCKLTAATDATIDRMRRQQLQADRSFADVDEGIRGYRKVSDTQTGQEADVNLGDANALNEADPGRYVLARRGWAVSHLVGGDMRHLRRLPFNFAAAVSAVLFVASCRLEAREPAGVRLGGGGDPV